MNTGYALEAEKWPIARRDDGDASEISPDGILQLGLAFWGSKTLLSAVELGLFTLLAEGPMTPEEVRGRLGLHPRAVRDFLDALVALRMLERTGGRYTNTRESALFLDRRQPTYVGGLLEMCNARLYQAWGHLTRGLKTGEPQNHVAGKQDLFGGLYADPEDLKSFLSAMTGLSMGLAKAMASYFPWSKYRTFVDVGAAQGCLPVQLALAHAHLQGGNFDLPAVGPVFEEYVRSFGLQDRLRFYGGSFFQDPLPKADVVILGHILHDWSLEDKRMLLSKAYAALPPGGAVIVYDAIIDDQRRQNAFGLLMSLNMLIETRMGFDYTGGDCMGWMREAGFVETRVEHLCGPDSMVIGFK